MEVQLTWAPLVEDLWAWQLAFELGVAKGSPTRDSMEQGMEQTRAIPFRFDKWDKRDSTLNKKGDSLGLPNLTTHETLNFSEQEGRRPELWIPVVALL